jgi:TPR repeat protein
VKKTSRNEFEATFGVPTHPSCMKIFLLLFSLLVTATPAFSQSASFLALLENATKGEADAQNEVAIAYSEGKGIKPDQKKAVYWFRKSAEQGYALGACNLALHYRMGWGVRGNVTLMWKYTFAAHALDGLKCNPADVPRKFTKRNCSMEKGWELAVAWLRAHPNFKNDFGRQPWNDSAGEYPETLRESGGSVQLPIRRSAKCSKRRVVK